MTLDTKALEAVKVKPLEWSEIIYSPELRGGHHAYAGCIFNENYRVWGDGTWSFGGQQHAPTADCADSDAAMAACQADYERRILSALDLSATPSRNDILEEAARVADEEALAMEAQREEILEHGTLGGRRIGEIAGYEAAKERRLLIEGYNGIAAAIRALVKP